MTLAYICIIQFLTDSKKLELTQGDKNMRDRRILRKEKEQKLDVHVNVVY